MLRTSRARGLLVAGCAVVLGVAGVAVALPGTSDEPVGRQEMFAAAAEEFDVPEEVLLAVSYLESRWVDHDGQPSTSAGYGPMHLTDAQVAKVGGHEGEDPRGDAARPMRLVAQRSAASTVAKAPELNTLEAAARLIGVEASTLRTDPVQNIRGGAALLAEYQREIRPDATAPGDWYGAVARYSGADSKASAGAFANQVFDTLRSGAEHTTDGGQVRLAANPDVAPQRAQLARLGLRAAPSAGTECPPELACESLPAPYEELAEGGYGNHDKANRPDDMEIDYIVIHDTEATWDSSVQTAQNPAEQGWHYTVRSSDGHVAQHVATKDVGWHAGNWDLNVRSLGVEHEGFAAEGTWYTEALYRSSAELVGYLAKRFDIPLDRNHVLGHDEVPGPTGEHIAGMHWDPGPYWDWAHYFDLLGAPLGASAGAAGAAGPAQDSGLVTILPDFATNEPAFTGCAEDKPGQLCPPRPSSAVVLRSEPRADAPLLTDIGLHPDGARSTMDVDDIGSRVSTGQTFAVADRQGDWIAIYYLGQVAWLPAKDTVPAAGTMVTPKEGADTVPVYGRAYPEAAAYPEDVEAQEIVPLPYTMPTGQSYPIVAETESLYYAATTFDSTQHVMVRGETTYLLIHFGHRMAYVDVADVDIWQPSI